MDGRGQARTRTHLSPLLFPTPSINMFARLALLALAAVFAAVEATPASSSCTCPSAFGTSGVVSLTLWGTQCAYPHGACTWDEVRHLTTTSLDFSPLTLSTNILARPSLEHRPRQLPVPRPEAPRHRLPDGRYRRAGHQDQHPRAVHLPLRLGREMHVEPGTRFLSMVLTLHETDNSVRTAT